MTDWKYFVIAWLPPDAPEPFPMSSVVSSNSQRRRIYASQPMSQLDAMLLRWRVASAHPCLIATEVVYSPVDDPFQVGTNWQ